MQADADPENTRIHDPALIHAQALDRGPANRRQTANDSPAQYPLRMFGPMLLTRMKKWNEQARLRIGRLDCIGLAEVATGAAKALSCRACLARAAGYGLRASPVR